MPVKRPLSKNIRCLKDFMKDPDREEPLIGLEYVMEVRFKGRREPFYECQLCQFNTEMAPMIEHLTGQRHRKTYLIKHYPEKSRRGPNNGKEEKVRFLRRIAREVEKTEGLKMYKREGYERPSIRSLAAKKKARFSSGYKPENDPVRRQKAVEYMEYFEITSDKEATEVIKIAQSLSEALKAFCEKKAALQHIRSLPPLLPPGIRNEKQQKPNKPLESYKDHPADNWKHGCLSNGLAQLQSLLQQAPSTSHNISSKDLATVSALKSSFAHQRGGFSQGINEWMKQFNQSASAYFQSMPAEEESPYFTSLQSSYTTQHCERDGSQVPDNRMVDSRIKNWDSRRGSLDSRAYPVTPKSYGPPRGYQADCSSQKSPSWYCDGPANSKQTSAPSFSSESNRSAWPQRSGPEGDLEAFPSFSGGRSYGDYQPQNTELNNVMSGSSSGLTADVMNQLRGKDAATLTSMLQQLVPYYPDLQKINIHALAQALSEMN
ncbi:uncharacterized protein LOC134401493 isoform X2 [Elgaria multicarinata webbii]